MMTPDGYFIDRAYGDDAWWQVRQQIDSYSVLIDCFKTQEEAETLMLSLQRIEKCLACDDDSQR